jgi:hypothetical protein
VTALCIAAAADGKLRSRKQDDKDPVVVEGGDSSPGQHTFYLGHPASSTFEISEEYIGDQVMTTMPLHGVSEAVDEIKSFVAGAQAN